MELSQHYTTDPETEGIPRPKRFRRVASGSAPKGCPDCRTPLRDIDRYNRIVKAALLDEVTRRFVSHANTEFAEPIETIQKREVAIRDERKVFMQVWSQGVGFKDHEHVGDSLKEYRSEGKTLPHRQELFKISRTHTIAVWEGRRYGHRSSQPPGRTKYL